MSTQLARLGHEDGEAPDGIKRFRRPPDFERSIQGDHVEVNLCVTDRTDPAIGETIEIDGERYLVRHSSRIEINAPAVLHRGERYVGLLLDDVGPSPHDPLMERARAEIEALGASVEGLSGSRHPRVAHVSIHAIVNWPSGMTAELNASGANDHQALGELVEQLQRFASKQ